MPLGETPSEQPNPFQSPGKAAKSSGAQRPTEVRWIVFALGASTSWLLYLHRYTFALLKPLLQEEWDLQPTELGLLDSAFSTCYMVFQFPLGVLGDLIGAHLVLTGMMLVWTAGFAGYGFAGTPAMLWWARAVMGVGQSGVFASLNRITRIWFPSRIRGTVQGVVGVLAGRLGGLSAYVLFGFLLLGVLEVDWRVAVYLLAGLGIAQTLAFALLFRNSPREHPWTNAAERQLIESDDPQATASNESAPPRKMRFREMFERMSPRSILNLAALNVQSILSTVADNIYSNWIPLFLFQVHGLKFKEMGIFSALPLLGGALGGLLGGWLNDYWIRQTGNRRWSRSGVAMAGKGLAAVCLLVGMAVYDNPYLFCGMLFFVKLFGDCSLSTTWATVTDIGGRATASVFAFNNSIAGLGAIGAPILYGYVAQYYSWKTVFLIAAVAYVLCSLSWLLVDCTRPILREEE